MNMTLSNIQSTIEKIKLPNEDEVSDRESVFTLFNMPLKTENELTLFEEYLADEGKMQITVIIDFLLF